LGGGPCVGWSSGSWVVVWVLGGCLCLGWLSVSWVVVCVLGGCLCPVSRVIVCVLNGCLCLGWLSVCWFVVYVFVGSLCVGWLSVCWLVVCVLAGCLCAGWLSASLPFNQIIQIMAILIIVIRLIVLILTPTHINSTITRTQHQPSYIILLVVFVLGHVFETLCLMLAFCQAKRPASSQQPNVYLEPKWLRYLFCRCECNIIQPRYVSRKRQPRLPS
jgi:hypothetical protein